jgi:hypothetical protein
LFHGEKSSRIRPIIATVVTLNWPIRLRNLTFGEIKMKNTIKDRFNELSKNDKVYASTVVPMFICWTIYLMIGIPVLMP